MSYLRYFWVCLRIVVCVFCFACLVNPMLPVFLDCRLLLLFRCALTFIRQIILVS